MVTTRSRRSSRDLKDRNWFLYLYITMATTIDHGWDNTSIWNRVRYIYIGKITEWTTYNKWQNKKLPNAMECPCNRAVWNLLQLLPYCCTTVSRQQISVYNIMYYLKSYSEPHCSTSYWVSYGLHASVLHEASSFLPIRLCLWNTTINAQGTASLEKQMQPICLCRSISYLGWVYLIRQMEGGEERQIVTGF